MPVSVELKYEYFNTWAGRVKIVELVSQFRVSNYINRLIGISNLILIERTFSSICKFKKELFVGIVEYGRFNI